MEKTYYNSFHEDENRHDREIDFLKASIAQLQSKNRALESSLTALGEHLFRFIGYVSGLSDEQRQQLSDDVQQILKFNGINSSTWNENVGRYENIVTKFNAQLGIGNTCGSRTNYKELSEIIVSQNTRKNNAKISTTTLSNFSENSFVQMNSALESRNTEESEDEPRACLAPSESGSLVNKRLRVNLVPAFNESVNRNLSQNSQPSTSAQLYLLKSNPRLEINEANLSRDNSIESFRQPSVFDDNDWPDTKKILEELENFCRQKTKDKTGLSSAGSGDANDEERLNCKSDPFLTTDACDEARFATSEQTKMSQAVISEPSKHDYFHEPKVEANSETRTGDDRFSILDSEEFDSITVKSNVSLTNAAPVCLSHKQGKDLAQKFDDMTDIRTKNLPIVSEKISNPGFLTAVTSKNGKGFDEVAQHISTVHSDRVSTPHDSNALKSMCSAECLSVALEDNAMCSSAVHQCLPVISKNVGPQEDAENCKSKHRENETNTEYLNVFASIDGLPVEKQVSQPHQDRNCWISTPSVFSPEADEFKPAQKEKLVKLVFDPEPKENLKCPASCPQLTRDGMADDVTETGASTTNPKGPCAVCAKEAMQRCANCRQVFYCKRECQREHWKKGHKNDCKPFKVEQSSTLGRYLVATRDFKAGDVIFKDDPLLLGPKQLTEPVCLGCYKRVDGSYRCRQCTWPMCGPACEGAPAHQPECVVGKIMGSPIEIADFSEVNHFYEVITTLRGLALKKKSPKKYEELLNLESHFNDRKGTHIYNENQKRVVNMLRNYFMLIDFPPEEIDASEASIHQMTGIIDTNAVDIPLADSEIVGIYPNFSMLEHSCTPNTKYRVSPSYQLTLKAAVNIREGEHLSSIYTHILWGTAARRDFLKSTRFFMCTCRRCADPTELGTNFSALRCVKCPLGFLMSAAPLDQLADWICTSCNATITADEANEITLQLGEDVERALATGKVKEIEDLIEKSSATVVHPNHFHLFAARHSLLQMLGRESHGLNEEAVKKKEKLCQEFLKTCTAIDPGMCKLASYVGVALYEYHLAVLARTREGPADRQVDKAALKKDLDTAKALLQQCIKVLQEEPPELPEGQLRLLAEQNLQELNQWESPNV